MKKKMNNKVVVLITTILILSLSLGVVVFADDNFETLQAWFGDINIFRNNQKVQLSADPFIVNGTTYVPLRAMSELFDKEVGWDGANYRIDLNDKPDENLMYMTQQIIEGQVKILELETEVAKLEAELKTKEETVTKSSLKDLQTYLNKQHDIHKKVRFDIELYETRNDIEVDIYVDLDYDYYEWNALYTSDIEKYIQNVVDDILYDFKDANVKGYIKDSSTYKKDELASFYTKSNGTVVVDTNYKGGSGGTTIRNLSDMQDYLNRNYGRYEGVDFSVKLYDDGNYIQATILVDSNDWSWLTKGEREYYLEEMYKDMIKEFPSYDLFGYVEDSRTYKELNYFDFNARGSVYLR